MQRRRLKILGNSVDSTKQGLTGKINKGLVAHQAYPCGSRNVEYTAGDVTCKHFSKTLIVLTEELLERLL